MISNTSIGLIGNLKCIHYKNQVNLINLYPFFFWGTHLSVHRDFNDFRAVHCFTKGTVMLKIYPCPEVFLGESICDVIDAAVENKAFLKNIVNPGCKINRDWHPKYTIRFSCTDSTQYYGMYTHGVSRTIYTRLNLHWDFARVRENFIIGDFMYTLFQRVIIWPLHEQWLPRVNVFNSYAVSRFTC